MNREIKFRGQRVDNGEWVYGNLISVSKESNSNKTELTTGIQVVEDGIFKAVHQVVPESVGQFTGRVTNNIQAIYEGDIIRWTNGKHYWEAEIRTLDDSKSNTLYAVETFCNLSTHFDEHDEELYSFERTDERKGIRNEIEFLSKTNEVIGNIHDNPELLSK